MSDNREEITEALAAELGIDTASDTPNAEADDFFASLEAEAPPEPEPQTFVHEPTGKEFDNEVEFLKYDAGYNADKWGNKFKEMEEKFEQRLTEVSSQAPKREETPQQALTREQLLEKLLPNRSKEIREDPMVDLMYEFVDNSLGVALQPLQKQLEESRETVASLQSQLKETGLRSQYGIDPQTEQKLIEQHAWLGQIGDPSARMAAMKDLAGSVKQSESSPKLADRIPQRSAADHVEGSVSAEPPDEARTDFEKKILDSDDKTRLGIFGKMFEESELGRRLVGMD